MRTTKGDYDPRYAIDGDPETAWNTEGATVGQWIRVNLGELRHVTRVGVIPGYLKVRNDHIGDRWTANARIRSARLRFSDGTSQDVQFSDNRAMQFFDCSVDTDAVTLEILAVYPGARYQDACISEIEVDGY